MILALTLLLAQTCVSEISFPAQNDECVVMWSISEINAKKAGRSLEQQVRKYHAYWKTRSPKRSWISELNQEGVQPTHWPTTANWMVYRQRWLDMLTTAEAFIQEHNSGTAHKTGCARARHYGGHMDRPKDKNLQTIDCAHGRPFRQIYWGY